MHFREYFSLRYEGRYRTPSNKLHVVSSQSAAGFAHTAAETTWINKDKDQCILRLHSQSPRHCKLKSSKWVSQTFRQSYLSHLISSYCLIGWKLNISVSTCVQKHTDLRLQDFGTLLYYSLGLDWLKLPALKGGVLVELIQLYKSWGSVFHTESLRRILTCFLIKSGSAIQTNHATFLNHSSSRPLQSSGSLRITQFPCTIQ